MATKEKRRVGKIITCFCSFMYIWLSVNSKSVVHQYLMNFFHCNSTVVITIAVKMYAGEGEKVSKIKISFADFIAEPSSQKVVTQPLNTATMLTRVPKWLLVKAVWLDLNCLISSYRIVTLKFFN